MRSPEAYLTSMVHLLDLTPESVSDLRLPIILSAVSLLGAFVAAWILRERRVRLFPSIALALRMDGFILAAHIPHDVVIPTGMCCFITPPEAIWNSALIIRTPRRGFSTTRISVSSGNPKGVSIWSYPRNIKRKCGNAFLEIPCGCWRRPGGKPHT